jgi:hypothetical protein
MSKVIFVINLIFILNSLESTQQTDADRLNVLKAVNLYEEKFNHPAFPHEIPCIKENLGLNADELKAAGSDSAFVPETNKYHKLVHMTLKEQCSGLNKVMAFHSRHYSQVSTLLENAECFKLRLKSLDPSSRLVKKFKPKNVNRSEQECAQIVSDVIDREIDGRVQNVEKFLKTYSISVCTVSDVMKDVAGIKLHYLRFIVSLLNKNHQVGDSTFNDAFTDDLNMIQEQLNCIKKDILGHA